ncbi:GNAT family N-acetyltransferase [Candidatus Gracilibacteria bacterium]|nr:MAG: GNAT family N-acetyltransferase [Candidatus Gracilibacteria bacterium]
MIHLVIPNTSHKSDYLDCIKKWAEAEKTPISPNNFFYGNSYEEFLEYTEKSRMYPEEGRVPATLFFAYDDDVLVGALDLRHHIDHEFLAEIGGHIGYGVAPKYRRKGYATKILAKGLEEAKKLGLKKVLVSCDDENIGSKKVIEKNGGVFERYTNWNGKKISRYQIDLS